MIIVKQINVHRQPPIIYLELRLNNNVIPLFIEKPNNKIYIDIDDRLITEKNINIINYILTHVGAYCGYKYKPFLTKPFLTCSYCFKITNNEILLKLF